ncbi:UbiH/UbiF/VisC/COQ6 family ubiquinone biosynthesis hydroxylase [Granulosicoccus antarcticus]|uniref:2-octaprenylphenol hydroxylase n=1 Tax=Granulosicoccus antarcticus IMCC3135 TaxID=1192854 RepID=A0A2Z2NZ55_9GAMM|nr:UbiH/UbiF/VisC/COQ6 family ubiquinone biosynthesis hydroxylase [Granulosicoccus antarcticus]ASJ72414.1 2-octaprenylphenol hydroxylase [Granulosicoccus antarcticus IMCC3135]
MTMQSECSFDYDVVIVGGGMVGSMLAAALATQGSLKVAVLEQQEPEPFAPGSEPERDIRVSALSIATQRMLEKVGAWQGIITRRACPYRQMLVWDGEAAGQTHFRASDIGVPELGHIVENRVLQLALLDVIKSAATVDFLCPASLVSYQCHAGYVQCELSDGQRAISTRLLVGADGGRSTVRDQAGIQVDRSPYPHHALVATVETELPQQDITWQRFQPTGPEAMLPLTGHHASLVWYHDAEEVKRLKALSEADFIEALHRSFPPELGAIRKILERSSFPIVKAHAQHYIAERVALIGDAAHTVHPLAGQGVNLGMLDAAALAQVLIEAVDSGRDLGSRRVLRGYERWRRGENALMISILDGFYHAFKPQPSGVRTARSAALNIADRAGPAKSLVMRYAMGTAGDLPALAQ